MNGEVLSVMTIKTTANADTKKLNNNTKQRTSDFKKTFEAAKNSKSEHKIPKDKDNNIKESKVKAKDSSNNSQNIEKEKVKVQGPKESKNLEKVDQQILKKVKDLLEKLGIEVSDEVLSQLAMKFDFSTIVDTLSAMKFINNNELDLSNLLETMENLTDSLESMKSFLMNESTSDVSQDQIKAKFQLLLDQLNGKIESIQVSETTKDAKVSIKELMAFIKDNFVSLEESNSQSKNTSETNNLIAQSEIVGEDLLTKEMAQAETKTTEVKVSEEEKTIDDSGSKKVSSDETKSNALELKNQLKTPGLEMTEKQVVVKEDIKMNFKEELNFRLLSKSQQSVKVFNQIKETISTKFDGKISEMKVLLDPKSLGKVELKLTIEKGNVLAEFEVQNTIVKQAIESNLQDLRNALSEKGYALEGLDVSVNQENQEESDQNQQYFENIFEASDDEETDSIALIEESKMLNVLNRRAISYLG
jgi:flagellar hook-length control protein FliK